MEWKITDIETVGDTVTVKAEAEISLEELQQVLGGPAFGKRKTAAYTATKKKRRKKSKRELSTTPHAVYQRKLRAKRKKEQRGDKSKRGRKPIERLYDREKEEVPEGQKPEEDEEEEFDEVSERP